MGPLSAAAPPWVADLGDGHYRNPVLNADWSDPDVVRVGADYYMTASSFHRVPGLPILHSRDLVNWTIIGHALPTPEPEQAYARPRWGCGVWAPAIRHHAGLFWIFYPDPDHGLYMVTAENPAGPWSRPHLLKAGRGLIDPCPLWDADGTAYLVHAWAKSRAGFNNRLTLHRMSPDARRLLDAGTVVVDGDLIPGCRTLEGPKIYRHGGEYWIFAPAGGVEHGWQSVFRAGEPFGPYEHRIVLAQGDTEINGPHQGAWVDTPGGEHWFLHFQDRGAYGRVVHLQPMRWRPDDGWPVLGSNGAPVLGHRKPDTGWTGPASAPATSDDFTGAAPGAQWGWHGLPDPAWWSLREPGLLRLACRQDTASGDLRALPNVLAQRLPATTFTATTSVTLVGASPGARAGLTVIGDSYAWVGLEETGDGPSLVHRVAPAVDEPEDDASARRPLPPGTTTVRLMVQVSADARVTFRADRGAGWEPLGGEFTATPGRWVGASVGLFATAPEKRALEGRGPAGHALFGAFEVLGEERG
ncbi:glycoside hydrolase family 43 protein [Actinomadura rudentiformis]|uniref:Glycosyl hydrolase 43 family protein n=1 Tax=Actinomadura rudentiformis TaxID=359158 RepID=A0A6H9YPC9_9ACTN|nr:glycoside hydrolase 43 family protein [Actinomadura rudentiformis]KAB2349553.1 glycosyl hydrolase 43 family protein [Actinomadura rudentiformis]